MTLIPSWARPLVQVLLVLALLGLALTLCLHVALWIAPSAEWAPYFTLLMPGLFVVFAMSILVMNRLTQDFKQKDVWKAALRGCPSWTMKLFYGLFGYAFLNMLITAFTAETVSKAQKEMANLRGISAILMTFYFVPSAVFYSALHVDEHDQGRRCPNGHSVSPLAKFCEECGQAIS